jgi:hypothetical protein
MMKITGQPYAGIRVAPTSPGTAPPSGMPVNITTSAVARSRLGVNSAFSAMTLGSTPPRAKPLMNSQPKQLLQVGGPGGRQRVAWRARCWPASWVSDRRESAGSIHRSTGPPTNQPAVGRRRSEWVSAFRSAPAPACLQESSSRCRHARKKSRTPVDDTPRYQSTCRNRRSPNFV